MEAFLIPLLPPVALSLALWAFIVWVSFKATGQGARRSAAAVSAVLSICGAIAFLGFAGSDDYNDYPGYTCALRDGHVPDGFPPERLPPAGTDQHIPYQPPLVPWVRTAPRRGSLHLLDQRRPPRQRGYPQPVVVLGVDLRTTGHRTDSSGPRHQP